MWLERIDTRIIGFCKKMAMPLARFSIFVVFFWFGFLKVIGLSPASGLVQELFYKTISFMQFESFLIGFGVFECLIGLLFLIKGVERVVIPLLFIHLGTTLGPLVLLPSMMWSGFMVPTMEAQYIIKNILIVALAISIASNLSPLSERHQSTL